MRALMIVFLLNLGISIITGQNLIINHHAVSAFDSIPEEFKQAASGLRMLFMDRSVGANIDNYLDCLSTPWASALSSCKRHAHQDSNYAVDPSEVHWNGTWDRSQWRYEFWPAGCSEDVNCFIDYIDDRLDSFDVMGCQFSYLAVTPGSTISDPLIGFFGDQGNDNKASTYAAFEAANPGKKVIWWTTSLARGIGTPESESFNDQMRDYAAQHDIILFDVADILSHNPAGEPCYDNRDGVAYKDESHPDDGLNIPAICPQYTTETDGGHLGAISAGGVRVAKAFWVLMARIAGWDGGITSTADRHKTYFRIFPNPASEIVQIEIPGVNAEGEYVIYDLCGRIKYKGDLYRSATVELPDLMDGIYLIQIMAGNSHETHLLMVGK